MTTTRMGGHIKHFNVCDTFHGYDGILYNKHRIINIMNIANLTNSFYVTYNNNGAKKICVDNKNHIL